MKESIKKFVDNVFDYVLLALVVVVAVVCLTLQLGFSYRGSVSPTAIIVYCLAGIIVVKKGTEMIMDLIHGQLGVDILALTAIIVTLFVNDTIGGVTIEGYWASLMIMFMIETGETLEKFAHLRATKELRSLIEKAPTTAHLIKENGSVEEVKIDTIKAGDTFLVRPGETVPVDGILMQGDAVLDCSSLTGESLPVERKVGESVLSGSVNGETALVIKADKAAADSQYQTIVKMVEDAANKPSHFVRLADRYAVPFTIVSYVLAGLGWLVAWLMNRDITPLEGLTRAAEVLVIASPCPLLLAAPIAFVSGMSRSSRNGIIIKNPDAMESMAKAKTVAFDKTGTITEGMMEVEGTYPVEGVTRDDLVYYAASAEQGSLHILSRSLLEFAKGRVLSLPSDVREISGQGVSAVIDGKTVKVGKPAFVAENVPVEGSLTSIYVSLDGRYIGRISFADKIRPESKKLMESLKKMGVKNLLMLTGDNEAIASRIASEAGITEYRASLKPQDKASILADLKEDQRPVVMIGDGVNDAPSLANADVGIAMGARGSSAAAESADFVIMVDDLYKVSRAMHISKDTVKVAKQSVLIGIFTCIALMVVAMFGVIPAVIGAILQEGIDLIAIGSALRAHMERRDRKNR